MPKRPTPITVFTASAKEALDLTNGDADSRALCTGPGTLRFHRLIAEHGAQEFRTLYVPVELKRLFKPAAGGQVKFTEDALRHPAIDIGSVIQ